MKYASLIVSSLLLMLLSFACDEDGNSNDINPFLRDIPKSTGNDLADRFIKEALECGWQDKNTVPAGWKYVFTGESGCSVEAPPAWVTSGENTGVTFAMENQEGQAGYISLSGVPMAGVSDCSMQGITKGFGDFLNYIGCNNVESLYYQEGSLNIIDIQFPKADYIFSCVTNGVKKVGYVFIHTEQSVLCSILVVGYWVPENRMGDMMCTCSQVLQSTQCPMPGGSGNCEDKECEKKCEGGYCGYDGQCVCE